MVKHTKTIRRQKPSNCLSVFDHFVKLALKGLNAPCYQCATHSSDLVMKRMAKSKTMSVPEVVNICDCVRRVFKHFEMSTKSKEILIEALAILEMNQLKLLSWGGTRMAHFVTTCKQFTKFLSAVYNCMCSTDIKREERDALFTVENIFVLLLMSDLKPLFKDIFLRNMIKDVMPVSMVYRTSMGTADQIKSNGNTTG